MVELVTVQLEFVVRKDAEGAVLLGQFRTKEPILAPDDVYACQVSPSLSREEGPPYRAELSYARPIPTDQEEVRRVRASVPGTSLATHYDVSVQHLHLLVGPWSPAPKLGADGFVAPHHSYVAASGFLTEDGHQRPYLLTWGERINLRIPAHEHWVMLPNGGLASKADE